MKCAPLPSREKGTETIGRRKIAFVRESWGKDKSVTQYGTWGEDEEREGGYLIKRVLGAKTHWAINVKAEEIEKGEAAQRQLLGIWDEPEIQHLWRAVSEIKRKPSEFHTEAMEFDHRTIDDLVLDVIRTGNRHRLDRLAKVIEAVHKSMQQPSKRWRVVWAVGDAARKWNQVPNWQQALQCFSDDDGDADDRNFQRALEDAGFGWILSRRGNRS